MVAYFPSFTETVLRALAVPADQAADELWAAKHKKERWRTSNTGHDGGPRWSCWGIGWVSLREAIAVERVISRALADENPRRYVNAMTDQSELAKEHLRYVRELLIALDQLPCATCKGLGTSFCDECGHTGRDEDGDACDCCGGRATLPCSNCTGHRVLGDEAVPVLWEAEAIAHARLDQAEERLKDAQAQHAECYQEHAGAYATLRRAEKAAGVVTDPPAQG